MCPSSHNQRWQMLPLMTVTNPILHLLCQDLQILLQSFTLTETINFHLMLINGPTKETQFVLVTAFFLIIFTHIYPGLRFLISLTQRLSVVCVLRLFRANRCCAALGCAMKLCTLGRKYKANESAGVRSFGANTVQHASAIKSSARTLSGSSHILKTMMTGLIRYWNWKGNWNSGGWRPSKYDSQSFWRSAFHQLSSLALVPDLGNNLGCHWGTCTLFRMTSATKVYSNFLMIENERT